MTLEDKELSVLAAKLKEFGAKQEPLPPNQKWFTLPQACFYKRGLDRKEDTGEWKANFLAFCYSNKKAQPNGGMEEGWQGGKRVWSRETVLAWLELEDGDLMPERKREGTRSR